MNRNSLKFRLFVSAILLLLVLLPAIGFTLNSAFEKHLIAAIENELSAQSYGILADIEYFDGQLEVPDELLDSQFNVIDSGLYALISSQEDKQPIWHSPSALNFAQKTNKLGFKTPQIGQRDFYQLQGTPSYFISSLSVSFADQQGDFPLTLHIIKNQETYLTSLNAFRKQLLLWLVIIASAFTFILWGWLKWTLKPLNQLTNELFSVEQGDRENVQGNYPLEVEPVISQLNLLLKNEQSQRLRYRNAMADLAHSLKTPLATIRSSSNVSTDINNEVDKITNIVEHQLKRAQSAGQSAWRLSVDVKPQLDKLLSAMAKIYRDKQIAISCEITPSCKFKGDEADLLEVLGNLIDNAYKAANSSVNIYARLEDGMLCIGISDDGDGVPVDEREQILRRGVRADTYQQGHGIGLAIVRDIVQSYQGDLVIEDDPNLGGALFILKFPN